MLEDSLVPENADRARKKERPSLVLRRHNAHFNRRDYRKDESYRFKLMAVLTFVMMMTEVFVGLAASSLTLLSDSLHMFSDLTALIIGFIAHKYSRTQENILEKENRITYLRMEVVGALINGTVLLTFCVTMVVQAIERLTFEREQIKDVDLVLWVGAIGLIVNILGLCIFGHEHSSANVPSHAIRDISDDLSMHSSVNHSHHNHSHSHHDHGHHDMNVRAVFYHVLADALGSIAVIASALIIKFVDAQWTEFVDPMCTLLVVFIISKAAYPLVKEAVNILLDRKPPNVNIDELRKAIIGLRGVLNVHELHVWEVTQGTYMATCHLVIDPRCKPRDTYTMNILDSTKKVLHMHGIHNSVVQREYPSENDTNWATSSDPCFDPICPQPACTSNSMFVSRHIDSVNSPLKAKSTGDLKQNYLSEDIVEESTGDATQSFSNPSLEADV